MVILTRLIPFTRLNNLVMIIMIMVMMMMIRMVIRMRMVMMAVVMRLTSPSLSNMMRLKLFQST